MSIVNDLTSPLRSYFGIAKMIGIALVVLAVIGFCFSWWDRGRQIAQLTSTQTAIVEAATLATVKPDKAGRQTLLKPEQVPAAIAALASSLRSADETLRWISAESLTAKAASEVADKALDADLDELRAEFERTDVETWNPWQREN
jgi:hypothetical protein